MTSKPIPVTAVWLLREGDDVKVFVEVEGDWYNAITEFYDGPFSHIAEARGIRKWPKRVLGKQEENR